MHLLLQDKYCDPDVWELQSVLLRNSANYTRVEIRNAGNGFFEASGEAESPLTQNSKFCINSFQGTALVFVEGVAKGNLKGSGYYFEIVGFGGR